MDTISNAQSSLQTIDNALSRVISARANLGTVQKTLEVALGEATTYSENLSASVSQIVDLDYANEAANLTRLQIMQEAGVASFTQAKNLPQACCEYAELTPILLTNLMNFRFFLKVLNPIYR